MAAEPDEIGEACAETPSIIPTPIPAAIAYLIINCPFVCTYPFLGGFSIAVECNLSYQHKGSSGDGSLQGDRFHDYPSAVDALTVFGLFAVTLMLITYAFERRSHWLILAFAGACALAPFRERQVFERPGKKNGEQKGYERVQAHSLTGQEVWYTASRNLA
jgi:hypothetical protein